MKKFLSVLLALAVAFTFTFGSTMSAFATTNEEYEAYYKTVDAAETIVLASLNANYTEALTMPATVNGVSTAMAKKAAAAGIEKVYTDAKASVAAKTGTIKGDYGTNNTKSASEIAALYTELPADATAIVTAATVTAGDAKDITYRTYFDLYKNEVLTDIAAISTDYDTTTQDITINGEKVSTTYATLANAEKSRLTDEANKITIASDASAAAVTTALGDFADITAAYGHFTVEGNDVVLFNRTGSSAADNKIYVDGVEANVVVLKTAKEVANDNLSLDTKKASAKSILAAASAALYQLNVTTNIATPDAVAFAAAEKERKAFETVGTYAIENATKTNIDTLIASITTIKTNADGGTNIVSETYSSNVAKIEELEAYAAKYAAEKDVDGFVLRDSAAIDEVVKAAKDAAYVVPYVAYNTLADDKETIKDNCYAVNSQFDFAKEITLNAIAKDKEEAVANYYALELPKVEKAYSDLVAKVNKCTTVTELHAITLLSYNDNAGVSYKTVPTVNRATLLTGINKKEAVKSSISTYVAAEKLNTGSLGAYAAYVNAGLSSTDPAYKNINAVDWEDFYAEEGARTEAEVKALADKAKAKFDTIKTTKEISDAKDAAQKAIAAIPAKVTVADKATVEAAFEAVTAYLDSTAVANIADLYNHGYYTAAVATLYALEKAALEKEITDLPATADKAAVKALKDKIDAFNEDTKANSEKMYEGKTPVDTSTLETKLGEFKTAEKNAVIAAINAIPLNVTAADKATVEKARELYDAYVAEYTNKDLGIDATADITNYADLTKAEDAIKAIEAETKYDNQDAKADLLDMSRKLTIWRTSKTSIKVTAVGSVKNIKDNGYTVKYSFYKKAPGATSYKLVKTTTSNKYTYTNLKKGTNKFQVKVKVYDADGKLVATKMTYYRAAKIK